MTVRQLSRRSLRHYLRSHLGALAGIITAAAVLVGALAVGDSVRESLKIRAQQRLGMFVTTALEGRDRFFLHDLPEALQEQMPNPSLRGVQIGEAIAMNPCAKAALVLPATAVRQDGSARANQVRLYGIVPSFFYFTGWQAQTNAPEAGEVWLSEALAAALNAKPGDDLVLRVQKPSALSRDAVITPRDDQSVALRARLKRILSAAEGGDFGLQANQAAPFNAFVNYTQIAKASGLEGRANLAVGGNLQTMVAATTSAAWLHSLKEFPSKGMKAFQEHLTAYSRPLPTDRQPAAMNEATARGWRLGDAELNVQTLQPDPKLSGGTAIPGFTELTTRRIFLEPAAVRAAVTSTNSTTSPPAVPILTYLVNSFRAGDQLTPYSMVTAAGPPYTPADLKDDEIIVNEWLARELRVRPGDTLTVAYYRADAGTRLVEHEQNFRVREVVPLKGLHADRTLMPEFPGLAKAESTRDWDAGFDLVHPIRDQDEAYWKQWRGTPKAFVSLAAGQKLWANRFGELTAVRWFPKHPTDTAEVAAQVTSRLKENLRLEDVGLVWQDVRSPALAAATTGQDFGGLFIGFSFFLIVSALLLTSMLFQFALAQRAPEVGILLAIGWTPKQVRRLLFREGFALAVLGSILGAVLGALYAKGVIWGLSTLWRDAVAGAGIDFHLTLPTLITGVILSLAVAAGTLWFALRRQAQLPARELLSTGGNELPPIASSAGRLTRWFAVLLTASGLGLTAMGGLGSSPNPELFFGAGASLLVGGLLWTRWALGRLATPRSHRAPVHSLGALALRGLTRRPGRSLGTIALLASAAFMIVAVAANRLEARRDALLRSSGTGGFALWGESTLPITQDLNTRKGQEFYGLDPAALQGVSVVGMRVLDGDDASCLNLNRAQRPRLLGVNPMSLAQRGAFTFTQQMKGVSVTNGWLALESAASADSMVVPAIGDANSIQWALGKKMGDTLEYLDERGQPFRVQLVGAVANSVLQGSLLISEADFVRRFPSQSGHRVFLIDAPTNAAAISATLSRALQDTGLELTSTTVRLNRFNAVQNTYLNTFQVLGGLGLLLGSIGLGVVVLRNVFERRGEIALMQAVGFTRSQLRRLILTEHWVLLVAGLGLGVASAAVAVLPAMLTPGSGVPWGSLAATLLLVFANGLVWTLLSVNRAIRSRLLAGLQDL